MGVRRGSGGGGGGGDSVGKNDLKIGSNWWNCCCGV